MTTYKTLERLTKDKAENKKTCSKCGKRKPRSEFHIHRAKIDGYHNWCKECTSAYYYNYRRKNKDKWNIVFEEKNINFTCEKCGYTECRFAIEFHHTDQTKKEKNIGDIINYPPTKKRIKEFLTEVEKCMILCANCHRELHNKIKEQTANA